MQTMPFVVIQVLECPFIPRIGEEVAVVGRTFRSFLIRICHFMIQILEETMNDGLQEAPDMKKTKLGCSAGCGLKIGRRSVPSCAGANSSAA